MKLKAPALKEAIKAERTAFRLKRELEQLDLEYPDLPRRREALADVRRRGKAGDVARLRR